MFLYKTYVNAAERSVDYDMKSSIGMAFLNIIVAIPNSSHHQSYKSFPDFVGVYLWRQSSDDVIMHNFRGL